ncbi:MAG: flagellar basal body-associated FliL family protein [Desulfobacterales bacterium]|uniref:Flagellar protein FliL n=1 Tax=Candidatus Desulfatibia profunda TaxID=2841695 RepID=A0A8J6TKR0_9BACT|nr:flagellar basal body-associated FliL family protein [Candidatus Desulfatibia profunda]MBL7179764.1 flagellar basal body-associated FliL family protein [Desulfobacterales bacterium]
MTEKDNDIDDSKLGIELDKLEVPKIDPAPISKAVDTGKAAVLENLGKIEHEVESEAGPSPKKPGFKVILATAAVVLAAGLFFLLNQKIIKLPFLTGNGKGSAVTSIAYHTIDPIVTNLGANKHIEISLMFKNDPELTKQISAANPIIRDDILMLLTSADMKKKIKESDLENLKSYIENEVTNRLKNNYNDKIILKELRVF